MSDVRLEPMTAGEYDRWLAGAVAEYARQKGEAAGWSADEALEKSRVEHASLLPNGPETPQMHLLTVHAGEEPIGTVWLHDHGTWMYLYDIDVRPEHRGQGLGKAAMLALEDYARDHGAAYIELNVWAQNTIARGLYQRLGYAPTSMHLRKDL